MVLSPTLCSLSKVHNLSTKHIFPQYTDLYPTKCCLELAQQSLMQISPYYIPFCKLMAPEELSHLNEGYEFTYPRVSCYKMLRSFIGNG